MHRIKQATQALHNLENQSSKQIAAKLVELRHTQKELDAAVEAAEQQGDFPESIRAQVEDILEAAPVLEITAAIRQDELEAQEKTKRIDLQQRLKLRFSTFTGKPEDVDIFLKKTDKIC